MNLRAHFLGQATIPSSRRQLAIGCIGLVILGVMVVVHTVAISIFLWAVTANLGGVVALVLLWLISVVAIFFIARGLRHYRERLRVSALSSSARFAP